MSEVRFCSLSGAERVELDGFGSKLHHVTKGYGAGQVAWVGDKHTQRFMADLGLVTNPKFHGVVD